MTFTPPNLATLWGRVNVLDEDFTTHIGRYKIPATASDEQPKPTTLYTLIARANALEISCESERTTQKEVFSKLIVELRAVLHDGNEALCKQGTHVLLGALLHRYFRLLNEYDAYNSAAKVPFLRWSIYKWDVTDSKLFKGIREVLQLPKETSSNFRKADLDKVDVATIVTALECFQNHMYSGDHYKEFPHLDQPNFKPQLQEIIDAQKARGSTVLKQFKAMSFLQSLVKRLGEEHQQLEVELGKWIKLLKRDHADLSKVKIETIEEHINAHVAEPILQEKIVDLLYTPFVNAELATLTPEQLIAKMKDCNSNSASYIITGACTLLLESADTGDDLQLMLYKVLGIGDAQEKLTNKDKQHGLAFLSDFNKVMKKNPLNGIDTQFFGDFNHYETQLSQLDARLIDRQKELAADIVVVASM